jgi:hypothetical protein
MLRAIFAIFAITTGCCISVAAAPTAAACPAGSYQASSGDCVEDPDQNTNNDTAICRDGSDSHSEHHSGTCSGHGGVAQWCPCGGTAPASASSSDSESDAPDPDTFVSILRVHGMTLSLGDSTAIAGGQGVCAEARSGKGADAISQDVKNDPTNKLTLTEAADFVSVALEALCPDVDVNVWADAMRLAGHGPAANPNS